MWEDTYSSNTPKFQTDLARGKCGESDVLSILNSREDVLRIIDTSDNKEYQQKEIDAVLILKSQRTVSIEIKTDYYDKTGNIVFEVFSSKTKGTPGGFVKTQSDYIMYYFPNTGVLYAIQTNPFKRFVLANKNNLSYRAMGDDALGFVVPIPALSSQPWFTQLA